MAKAALATLDNIFKPWLDSALLMSLCRLSLFRTKLRHNVLFRITLVTPRKPEITPNGVIYL